MACRYSDFGNGIYGAVVINLAVDGVAVNQEGYLVLVHSVDSADVEVVRRHRGRNLLIPLNEGVALHIGSVGNSNCVAFMQCSCADHTQTVLPPESGVEAEVRVLGTEIEETEVVGCNPRGI